MSRSKRIDKANAAAIGALGRTRQAVRSGQAACQQHARSRRSRRAQNARLGRTAHRAHRRVPARQRRTQGRGCALHGSAAARARNRAKRNLTPDVLTVVEKPVKAPQRIMYSGQAKVFILANGQPDLAGSAGTGGSRRATTALRPGPGIRQAPWPV